MGLLLKNNFGWGPKQQISSAFFDDILQLIGDHKEYQILANDIRETIFFYTYTLDYRERSLQDLILIIELVVILYYSFDDIYANRMQDNAVLVYKQSIFELKNLLFEKLNLYEK